MKKLLVLISVVALLSGCATDNPHLARVEKLGGTATGGALGVLAAKAVGGNESLVIGAGILTAIMGHEAVAAAQWEDRGYSSPSTVVVVPSGAPYGYGAYGGHYDRYGRVYGAYGGAVYGYDPRYFYRDGYCHGGDWRIIPCPGAYVSPPAMTIITVPKPSAGGPTVDNYHDWDMIHPECKTKLQNGESNWGADGKCLLRLAPALKEKQKLCEADPNDPKCPKKYNPGKWAQIYRRLGGELIARQRE
ncbi:MAG: hypothetical protein AAB497_03730 [Patescibacteria group bacterium]